MTARRNGAPRSGCRICGRGARARTSRCRRAALSLTAGDVVGLTVNGRRRLIELQEIVRHRKPRDQGAFDRSGGVRLAARRRRACARRRSRRRSGRCMRWCSICRRLTIRAAAGADAARGVRRSMAGAGGGLELGRRLELSAHGAGARACDRRRDARRSAGGADGALASRKLSRAALRRRAGVGLRHCVCSPAPMPRRCSGRRRVGSDPVRRCRACRRAHLSTVAAAAWPGRKRMGDGRAVAGGRAVCAARPAGGAGRPRARRAGAQSCSCAWSPPTATTAIRSALALTATPQATALEPLAPVHVKAVRGDERRDLHLDPPHAHRRR